MVRAPPARDARPAQGVRVTAAAGLAPALAPARAVLGNGLVVLAREARTTPAVTIHASIEAGARFDPPDGPGVSHFVSRTIDRGTRAHTADELAEALDARGVSLEVTADRRAIALVCTCLVEDFDAVLEIVADVVTRPAFDQHEVATRRGEILTLIRQDQDDPYEVASEHMMAELYGAGHPYGHPVMGTRESVDRINRGTLALFHGEWFAPGRLSLAIVGDVETARAIDTAASVFDQWTATPAQEPALAPPAGVPGRRLLRIPMPGKSQADIAYGFTSIPRRDRGYDAAWLMMNVVGQYSLGGRLGDRIRERDGMAYYVFGGFESDVIAAPLVIEAGVDSANVDRTIATIDEELEAFRTGGPTDREMAESRQYLVGSLPRMLETNAGIASFLQLAESFDLGLDYDVRLREQLEAVTREQVHEAARRLVDPARATIVVAAG